jgi:glycosyltransferase involved in cell wall biosynthesis
MRRPAVSIVIPCFYAVEFVPEALESVFTQTFADFEVVVVNDGSPQTRELEELLTQLRPRIRYVHQPNGGPSSARNNGIRNARGKYIAFLDSDDVWMPTFLAELVQELEEKSYLEMAYSGSLLFGHPSPRRARLSAATPRAAPTFENLIGRRCNIHPSCVVARATALHRAGLFDESLTYSEDLDLWARLTYGGGQIGYVDRILARRRLHENNLTLAVDRLIQGQLEMSGKLLKTLPALTEQQRKALEQSAATCAARLELVHGSQLLFDRRYTEAVTALRSANRVLGDWKLHGAIAVMRLAPRLARRIWFTLLAGHPTLARSSST